MADRVEVDGAEVALVIKLVAQKLDPYQRAAKSGREAERKKMVQLVALRLMTEKILRQRAPDERKEIEDCVLRMHEKIFGGTIDVLGSGAPSPIIIPSKGGG